MLKRGQEERAEFPLGSIHGDQRVFLQQAGKKPLHQVFGRLGGLSLPAGRACSTSGARGT